MTEPTTTEPPSKLTPLVAVLLPTVAMGVCVAIAVALDRREARIAAADAGDGVRAAYVTASGEVHPVDDEQLEQLVEELEADDETPAS